MKKTHVNDYIVAESQMDNTRIANVDEVQRIQRMKDYAITANKFYSQFEKAYGLVSPKGITGKRKSHDLRGDRVAKLKIVPGLKTRESELFMGVEMAVKKGVVQEKRKGNRNETISVVKKSEH